MANKLTIVTVPEGDWEGLYLNGDFFDEGHEIRLFDFQNDEYQEVYPIGSIEFVEYENFDSYAGDNLPEKLEDILKSNRNEET